MGKQRGKSNAGGRRGAAVVYVLILSVVVSAFVSLAVDVGRAKLAKTQLGNAAEAAARAGAGGLSDSTALTKATSAAQLNYADGYPVVLQASDIEIGIWTPATHTFFATGSGPNAVRVTAQDGGAGHFDLHAVRGNPGAVEC